MDGEDYLTMDEMDNSHSLNTQHKLNTAEYGETVGIVSGQRLMSYP